MKETRKMRSRGLAILLIAALLVSVFAFAQAEQAVCTKCGYTQWVHDSYMKDETDGTDEGHIEVLKCGGCGALRYEKQPHDAGEHVAYRADDNQETHVERLVCTVCGEQFEKDCPHEFERDSCKNDGNTNTHIEALVCIFPHRRSIRGSAAR